MLKWTGSWNSLPEPASSVEWFSRICSDAGSQICCIARKDKAHAPE